MFLIVRLYVSREKTTQNKSHFNRTISAVSQYVHLLLCPTLFSSGSKSVHSPEVAFLPDMSVGYESKEKKLSISAISLCLSENVSSFIWHNQLHACERGYKKTKLFLTFHLFLTVILLDKSLRASTLSYQMEKKVQFVVFKLQRYPKYEQIMMFLVCWGSQNSDTPSCLCRLKHT